MHLDEITGRAIHESGDYRVDRRLGTSPLWEYQVLKLLDPDEGPEWSPVPKEDTANWPRDGWEGIDDW